MKIGGGLIGGFFVAGFVVEQTFSVLSRGKEGRWFMLLLSIVIVVVILISGIRFSLQVGLWSSLGAASLVLGISVLQNITYR